MKKSEKKTDGFITTGVEGLDQIFKGGIKKRSSLLVVGVPGTGKSILCMHFIYEGAKRNEPGLFVCTEETADAVRGYSRDLGMNLEEYEKKGLITIVEQKISGSKIVSIQAPMSIVKQKKIKRMAFDSLSVFEYIYKPDGDEYRKGLLQFVREIKSFDINLVAVSERDTGSIDHFVYMDEDFLFDGILIMAKTRNGPSFERVLHLAKMKGQDILLDIYPFSIGKKGITVYPKEVPFSLTKNE